MAIIAMKELLEAGVHFGHQTKRWNPKMKEYIFQERNGIHIIDLQKTSMLIDEAYDFVRTEAENGGTFLFVGTKKQAEAPIKDAADKSSSSFVNKRWLGGMLTNFKTIRRSVAKLKKLEAMQEDGVFDLLTKKEAIQKEKEIAKLESNLGGVKEMNELPSAVIVVDPSMEEIAVAEARRMSIPVIAITDTNASPDGIDFVIPANDDAIRSISLILNTFAEAILEGREGLEEEVMEEEMTSEDSNEENEEINDASEETENADAKEEEKDSEEK